MQHTHGPGASPTRFFVLTFAITWSLQLPALLAQRGWLPGEPAAYMPLAMLGVFGPALAAVQQCRREGGREAVRELLSGLRPSRVGAGWVVAALLVPAALLSTLLTGLCSAGYPGDIAYLPGMAQLVVAVIVSLGEEVGWRGYAQRRLQRSLGVYPAAGLVGVVWTVWHIPMFLGVGIPLTLLPVMCLYFVGGSLWIAWIYQGSGSLLLAVLAHLGAHLNNSHRALPGDSLPLVAHAVIFAGLGLWVATRALRNTRPVWPRGRLDATAPTPRA